MSCKERLEAYLSEHGVTYEVQQHPEAFTARQLAASEQLPGAMVAKTVLLWASGRLVMLVLPASDRIYIPRVEQVLGTKGVRLAEEKEFGQTFADCQMGTMPPFGNLYDVPVYVDRTLAAENVIYFPTGSHTETMSMFYRDYERLVQPEVTSFSLEDVLVGNET